MITGSSIEPTDGQAGQVIRVGPAWAGHPVGFALLTTDRFQFVAFYDEKRILTVVSRALESSEWESIQLPEEVGWDSHNGLAMGRDEAGCLHLSGNMHADPLVYFRTSQPDAIQSFEQAEMVGVNEDRVTYPEFFKGPGNSLCYGYRDGSSGSGDQIYNRYLSRERRWERLSSGTIVSGEGVRNAYLDGPHHGPDGLFHLCWVWRDTPHATTNHTVCYARSRDLVHWETSDGAALRLPITFATAEVVDPVPTDVGLMNGNVRLGFDPDGRAVITYHKLDGNGSTQIYNTRRESDGWRIYQTTDWDWAWLPTGTGSIIFEIRTRPVRAGEDGTLTQRLWTAREGDVKWELDPATLRPRAAIPALSRFLQELNLPARDGMRVNWAADSGSADGSASPFALRWESLPENRDHPRSSAAPEPTLLQVLRLGKEDQDFLS